MVETLAGAGVNAADKLRVYWRPGCSSCVRVKEFLTGLGVPYESINVSATPQAMEELRELGVRTVPVVARGREYVFAQELVDVSRFIGREVEFRRLPAPELVDRWLAVLTAAQRHIAQIPPARLGERATEGRGYRRRARFLSTIAARISTKPITRREYT